ncbi:hydroxymethylglutaryl-CoA synthase 1 [Chrysoperla carnea]|uniref:hydroxymethylglutaryl-CoA synthase 1 n=1 Tax=Chrysoperla carnea TaxID=189513 RepID=UPI001D07F33D|nr:hydroxymethylglutaryl-CoA synthase 1 [Chrysoperla carnea]
METWPKDVGILAIELIFPSIYVDQTDLEKYDGVSTGKYTIGLGQSRMGFCSDREDIHSLCLTVVHKLIEKYGIKYSEIGRLEVGTETIVDKSKSVKSVLMSLFEPHGCTDLEGIDTTNACYGGTAALFNAIQWVESSFWDGRYALVVAGDIAVYAKGSARPTGGAGAVAMLIGPNAPIVFDRGLRSTYMKHAYDFYKPDLSSEYPVVDGKLSIQCYLSALDHCYQGYCKKVSKLTQTSQVDINFLDAMLFHSPYCKLVQKSFGRLMLNDFVRCPKDSIPTKYPGLEKYANVKLNETYFDRDIEKIFLGLSKDLFEKKTRESLLLASEVGNMYTASVYSSLVSLLINKPITELAGMRVGLFSYGSGLASTMYSITLSKDITENSKLCKIIDNLTSIKVQLNKRVCITPESFTKILEVRELNNHAAPYTPVGSIEHLFPGTYYLKQVDELHRRSYERVHGVVSNGNI